jgi:hypothetical protein
MWVKKTEEEIQKDHIENSRSFILPGGVSAVALMIYLWEGFDCGSYGKGGWHQGQCWEWEEFLKHVPMIFLVTAGVFLAVFFVRRIFLNGPILDNVTTLVCDKCGKVKANDRSLGCSCGGRYSDIEKMKWIE